jgi:major vault protein
MMFMPDPRTDVIVKRVLSAKEVELWFPGNQEALQYNVKSLGENMVTEGMTAYYAADMSAKKLSATAGQYSRSTMRFSDDAVLDDFADGVKRQTEFTPPRTITLDNKFEGAVSINVWPGYAVQVVNRTGERKVVQGPQTILLDYDQTLETLALSTGRPKTDTKLLRTVYLHVQNNKVSDQVTVQTKDLVDVGFQLSYKVNFEGDSSKWFSVQNYIKLMTDNLRSIIRKEIKSYGIQEINNNAIAIIRDVILGKKDEETGERKHRTFDENGMTVYDVEILGIEIGNKRISELLTNAQHTTVSNTIELAQAQANLNLVKERQRVERETLEEQRLTQEKKLANDKALTEKIIETEAMKHNFEVEKAKVQSILAAEELTRESNAKGVEVSVMKEKIKIQTEALVSQMNAISPDLIAAINSLGDKQLATALAENLPKATGTAGYLFGNGGIEGLLKMVAGTPLEASLKEITSKKNTKKTAE